MGLNLPEDFKIRSGKEQAMPCSWMGKLNAIRCQFSHIFFLYKFNVIQIRIPTG